MTSQKTCIFCASSLAQAGRSKEDVIPKWLLKHLGLDKSRDLIASSNLTDMGIPLQRPRIQGSHTILQGAVCESCNNGWMSDLETQAKPIVTKMCSGEALDLTQADCNLLSAWIFKTLTLWHVTSNYRELVPLRDFQFLYQNGAPPPGRHVEIAYAAAEPLSAFRTRMSPIKVLFLESQYDKAVIMQQVDRTSYILTMQIGRLLTQVVGLPPFGAWARADRSHDAGVLRIFPRVPQSLSWPPAQTFDQPIDGLNTHVALRLHFL